MARRRSNRAHKAGLMGALAGFLDGLNRNWQTAKAQEAQALKEARLAEIRAQERSEDREFQLTLMDEQQRGALERAEQAALLSQEGAEFQHNLSAEDRKAARAIQERELGLRAAGVGLERDRLGVSQEQLKMQQRQAEIAAAEAQAGAVGRVNAMQDAETRIGYALDQSGQPVGQMTQAEARAKGLSWSAPPDQYKPPVAMPGFGGGLLGAGGPTPNPAFDKYFTQ